MVIFFVTGVHFFIHPEFISGYLFNSTNTYFRFWLSSEWHFFQSFWAISEESPD